MKLITKHQRLWLTICASAFLLTACGGDDDNTTSQGTETPPSNIQPGPSNPSPDVPTAPPAGGATQPSPPSTTNPPPADAPVMRCAP